MTEPAENKGDTPAPVVVSAPLTLPVSLWIWLAVLVATYVLPQLVAVQSPATKVVKSAGITSASFAQLSQAEYQARLALAPRFANAGSLGTDERTPGAKRGESVAQTAADTYRTLAAKSGSVVSARKALVLEHRQKKPLDEAFLTGTLAKNLSGRGAKSGTVGAELALWRFLYDKSGAQGESSSHLDDVVERVKALRLGLLQDQAIADVYARFGRTADASRLQAATEQKATADLYRAAAVFGLMGLAGLTGVVFLMIFGTAWLTKAWGNVGRLRRVGDVLGVEPPFGALLDVFVAYLALSRGVGLIIGSLPGVAGASPVLVSAGVYVGTGLLSIGYLASVARRNGWNLSLIGLRGLNPGNLLYGIAGYCAAIPVVFAVGAINARLLRNEESSLAPNPILPLIAGEGNLAGRIVLFLLVAVAAPLIEELFFRGVLYGALRTRFAVPVCVVVSAACFAVVHPMGDWLPIFGLGCLLATVRELRQSVVPGMVMHFFQNAMAFLVMSIVFSR